MQKLIGTPKQIAWATDIRKEAHRDLKRSMNAWVRQGIDVTKGEGKKLYRAAMSVWKNPSAKFWIENRHAETNELISAEYGEDIEPVLERHTALGRAKVKEAEALEKYQVKKVARGSEDDAGKRAAADLLAKYRR